MILGHIEPEKRRIVNEAPTVLRSSTRLALCLINSSQFKLWSRDIGQAYLKSDEELHRTVFVRPTNGKNILSEQGAPEGSNLRAIKPLYGLTEAPGDWWQTFKRWHKNNLGMRSAVSDPCFFYKLLCGKFEGVQVTQVDGSLGKGNEDL